MQQGGIIQASLTDFHAKFLAHELTKRCASDSLEKLAPVLADAQVDLNPHQVEAALFALRSPFSKGAILADEVGDGKTIEAGLLLEEAPQELLEGSAALALRTEPRFDRYLFIERNPARCAQLKEEFPELEKDIEVLQGEANAKIRELCGKDWRTRRAVLFLDPYGMQVEWTTIEKIAATKAIDLWVLFPLGMGVNRLLKKSGDIPPEWRARLDVLLGTRDWFEEFYRFQSSPTLFDEEAERAVKASTEVIGRYFNDRLRSVFAGVAEEPRVLRNSRRAPLYLLCFAVGNPNPKAADLALRIANHLLKRGAA